MKRGIRSELVVMCGLILLCGTTKVALGVANDDCASATPVGNVTNLAFDTTDATFDGPGHYITGRNVWYCYTASCTGTATISLFGSDFDTRLAVYDGCECYPSFDALMKASDDVRGRQGEGCIPVTAGNQYLIEVGGFGAAAGEGVLTITCDKNADPPANDNCENATHVGNVTDLPFDTTCATLDGVGLCARLSHNIWYRYTASRTGNVTVSLLGSEYDTSLSISHAGACPPTSEIECNDDFGDSSQSQITFPAVSGHAYLIEVGGYNLEEFGRGVLSISSASEPPLFNDDCVNARKVGDVTNLPFDTREATFDGPGHCMNNPNLWYRYTAPCTGQAIISLCGSNFDTMLAVYRGWECYPKSSDMIGCNDDACGGQSELTLNVVAGSNYLIEVGGYGDETGRGVLSISCEGEPGPTSPDDCANAKPIGNVTDLAFDTSDATFDGPGLCMDSPNIWYCYTASCTGNVTVTTSGTTYDTMLAAYNGCACYPTSSKLLQCNDDYGNGTDSQLTFAATAGNQYLIEVGGYSSEKGQGLLTVSCEGVAIPDKTDLGDAPDSTNHAGRNMTAYPAGGPLGVKGNYPTVYLSGDGAGPYGPVHLNAEPVAYLGKKITRETEADSGLDEDGVNNINPSTDSPNLDQGDDGVVVPLNMPACRWTTFGYTVSVVDSNVDLYVNVWCDWNRDGDWDDTLECVAGPVPEWAVQNQLLFNLPVGLNQIRTPAFLPWHPATGPEEIWMRITLSEQPFKGGSAPEGKKGAGGSGPFEKYLIGETEDYYFTPDLSFNVCEDFNGDGVVNTQDLVDLTAAWLEACPQ